MLKINLLPPYIYEGKSRRNFVILWVVVLAAVIGGFIFWKTTLDAEATRITKAKDDMEPTAKRADDAQALANSINQRIALTKAKADFVRNALRHNRETYPTVYDNVRDYTISRAVLNSMTPAGAQVNVNGYAPSLADVAHYVMYMERNPKISSVSIGLDSIPAFPAPRGGAQQPATPGGPPGGHLFTASLNLVQPIPGAPTYAGSPLPASGPATPGAPPGVSRPAVMPGAGGPPRAGAGGPPRGGQGRAGRQGEE